MISLAECIVTLENEGYVENLTANFDHFSCRVGEIEIYPKDFQVDKVVRFENASDPGDQSILYAISSSEKGIKGLFVESYGLYHENLSPGLLEKLTEECRRHGDIEC